MKFNDLQNRNEQCEVSLARGYAELEAASRRLFSDIARLNAIKSTINDRQFWAKFSVGGQSEMSLVGQETLRKFCAAWLSAWRAYESNYGDACRKAEALIAGPIAETRANLLKQIAGPDYFLLHGSNLLAAEQLARAVLSETRKTDADAEQVCPSAMAQAALDILFESNFSGLNGGWRLEAEPGQAADHLGPAISDHMVFLPVVLEGLLDTNLDLVAAVPGLLERAESAMRELRKFKGTLNEDTFGMRLQKVLKKPAEAQALVEEQHARRCHLASLLADAVFVNGQLRGAMSELGGIINMLVFASRKSSGADQIVQKNNALALVQLCRRMYVWSHQFKAEQDQNQGIYDTARAALADALTGEEPTPQPLAPTKA